MTRILLLVLFFSVAQVISIFDACYRLAKVPCDQAFRDGLAGWMPALAELERRFNQALRAKLTRSLSRRTAWRPGSSIGIQRRVGVDRH